MRNEYSDECVRGEGEYKYKTDVVSIRGNIQRRQCTELDSDMICTCIHVHEQSRA